MRRICTPPPLLRATISGPPPLIVPRRDRSPLSVVVINNGGYGAMRAFSQTLNVKAPPGIDLPGIDAVQIAAGFGCMALRVDKAATLERSLRDALRADGPVLIDVPVDPAVPKLY